MNKKLNNVNLLDESRTPVLYKWAKDFFVDSVIKDVMPRTDKLTQVGKVVWAKIRAQASS